MKRLSSEDRLRLMRFVCSFAWADFEVQDEERVYIAQLIRKLKLSDEEAKLVDAWLEVPPRPEEVDPQQVPRVHRQRFLDEIKGVVMADGVLDPNEEENLKLLEALLS